MIHEKYKKKGLCVGPLGFPCKEATARQLESQLKESEKEGLSYKRQFVTTKPLTIEEGERADISVISTIDVDRDREIVLSSGADVSHFERNPVVTLAHDYKIPPVGRAQWMRFEPNRAKATHIKAKTEYAPEGAFEVADVVWNLVKAGFLVGKSVGFLPLEVSPPSQKEIDTTQGAWSKADRVIRKWMMFEYAVATVPANQSALVEAVAKGSFDLPDYLVKTLGLSLPEPESETVTLDLWTWDDPAPPMPKYSKSWSETEAAILKSLSK